RPPWVPRRLESRQGLGTAVPLFLPVAFTREETQVSLQCCTQRTSTIVPPTRLLPRRDAGGDLRAPSPLRTTFRARGTWSASFAEAVSGSAAAAPPGKRRSPTPTPGPSAHPAARPPTRR